MDIAVGPDANIWFTEFELNKIGKLTSTSLVAAGITSVTSPAAIATSLTMPTVPDGYTIAIATSSNTNVIDVNGKITSSATATTVNLTFTVTNTTNHSTAITASIPVTVPAGSNVNGDNRVNTGVEILVNGKAENAGTAATTTRGSQTVTTITVDSQKLEQMLKAKEANL